MEVTFLFDVQSLSMRSNRLYIYAQAACLMLACYIKGTKNGESTHRCLTKSKRQETACWIAYGTRLNRFNSIHLLLQLPSTSESIVHWIRSIVHTLCPVTQVFVEFRVLQNQTDKQLHHSDACPNTVGNLPKIRRPVQERDGPRSASSTSNSSLSKNNQTPNKTEARPKPIVNLPRLPRATQERLVQKAHRNHQNRPPYDSTSPREEGSKQLHPPTPPSPSSTQSSPCACHPPPSKP